MSRVHLLFVLALVFICAGHARAQGTIAYSTCTPPKAGSNAGEILVKGSILPDMLNGWKVSGTTVTVTAWQDGSVDSTATITIVGGVGFDGKITGLTSKASYNVTVEGTVINNSCVTATLKTEPYTVVAP